MGKLADPKFKLADARFKSADALQPSPSLIRRVTPRLDTALHLPKIPLMPTPLQSILESYRATSQTEREKGSYFEELIRTYLRFEASYAELYSEVWLFADWVKEIGGPQFGFNAKDTGIDLVAKTRGTDEYHAIQCKCYAPTHRVMKADIDSFFTASGKTCFSQRLIVATTNDWSDNAAFDPIMHR